MAISFVRAYIATAGMKTRWDSEYKLTIWQQVMNVVISPPPVNCFHSEEQISFSDDLNSWFDVGMLNGSSPELNWVAATLKSLDTLCSRKSGVVNFRCLDVLIRTFPCSPSLNSESYLSLHSLRRLVDDSRSPVAYLLLGRSQSSTTAAGQYTESYIEYAGRSQYKVRIRKSLIMISKQPWLWVRFSGLERH